MTFIVMLTVSLLIPAIMIGFGYYFAKNPPKKINPIFGYRTARSMKNDKTWAFAHRTVGKLWQYIGFPLLATAIPLFFFRNSAENTVGTVGCIIMGVQTLCLILSVVPVEISLKKHFDDDGNEK